jgi:hypothetical protein
MYLAQGATGNISGVNQLDENTPKMGIGGIVENRS